MECNLEEAKRAKERAEEKFKMNDKQGAKRLVMKAMKLFPKLRGISGILTAYQIHIAAAHKINSQPDWYGILNVSHLADTKAMNRQYKKLAVAVHPDKNSSIAADGAFKLITDAKDTLSDDNKRKIYDSKRSMPTPTTSTEEEQPSKATPPPPIFQSNCSWCAKEHSFHPKMRNSFQTCTKCETVFVAVEQGSVPPPPPPSTTTATVWSKCTFCGLEYEYDRKCVNTIVECPNCMHNYWLLDVMNTPDARFSLSGHPGVGSPASFWTICCWCTKFHVYKRDCINSHVKCDKEFVPVDGEVMLCRALRFFGSKE